MIVNSLDAGWEVIYQRSHANLAAQLVAAWSQPPNVPRWTEIIIATAQHDDQEMFWDESRHLTELGAPLDFTQGDLNTRRIQARGVIANAYRQGVWIALLISRHNSFLYEPMRGQDKHLDEFLDEQQRNQKQWRKLMGCDEATFERAYSMLGWGDRLSLILCRRELPDSGRYLDIAPGPDGTVTRVTQREDGTIHLDPWVLTEDDITFTLETRRLKQLQFKDEAEFLGMLGDAKIEMREWHFRRG